MNGEDLGWKRLLKQDHSHGYKEKDEYENRLKLEKLKSCLQIELKVPIENNHCKGRKGRQRYGTRIALQFE